VDKISTFPSALEELKKNIMPKSTTLRPIKYLNNSMAIIICLPKEPLAIASDANH
jgi:hypothetical protein